MTDIAPTHAVPLQTTGPNVGQPMVATPSVGRFVHYHPNPNDPEARHNHGGARPDDDIVVPAVIVRVWSPDSDTVNLMVFPDGPAPLWRTSVQGHLIESSTGTSNSYWSWPPRV